MDPNEITKVIDGVYKNILDNFNPSSRQMIATGKAYLKSLHGASAACSLYLDTMVRLSRQAQQSSLGNSSDIGSSLMQITEVFKDIHAQQLNTLKAFYVDFLVPLETNLEKDTRVIQSEQKKFLMCHKQRIESFNKAASSAKKMKKKSKKSNNSTNALGKEIKVMQNLEEEKAKLEGFCEKSMRDALTQERRRYGFILERQTSLAKHYLAFYSKGNSLLNSKLENWMKVAKSRETLPENMNNSLALLKKMEQGCTEIDEDCIYCSPRRPADDTVSISSQLRKTKSMDASEIINCQQADLPISSGASISRAKSDLNLMSCSNGEGMANERISTPNGKAPEMPSELQGQAVRPKSLAVASEAASIGYGKALYAYLSSGENQLSFLENDPIALIGDRNKGWQFGENLRTQKTGWFPVAYTELESLSDQPKMSPSPAPPPLPTPLGMNGNLNPISPMNHQPSFHPTRLNTADVIVHRTPESLPLNHKLSAVERLKPVKMAMPGNSPSGSSMIPPTTSSASGSASDSLHSSNDSGFSNDLVKEQIPAPPQPDVDYSDGEEEHLLRNSEELNSGDKWLMDRYHMSESVRVGGPKNARRSLSFSNVSGCDEKEDTRGHTFNSRRHGNQRNMKDGAFKKLINRTKSLIWKRPEVPPPQTFDSISAAESCENVWACHTSIVDLPSEFEMQEMTSSKKEKKSESPLPSTDSSVSRSISLPLPPPMPKETRSHGSKVEKVEGFNQKDSDSCIVISDHMRRKNGKNSQKGSARMAKNQNEKLPLTPMEEYKLKKSYENRPLPQEPHKNNNSLQRSQKEKMHQQMQNNMNHYGDRKIVSRIESFSGSEAPIVPMTKNNLLSEEKLKSVGRHFAGRAFTNRYIAASKVSYNSDEDEEEIDVDLDDEDDEDDFTINGDFEDNISSSVFIEPELMELPPPPMKGNGNVVAKKSNSSIKVKSQSMRIVTEGLTRHYGMHRYLQGPPSSPAPPVPSAKMELVAYGQKEVKKESRSGATSVSKSHRRGSSDIRIQRPAQFKGSIRSEFHQVELISSDGKKPIFDYGSHLHRRLYFPERTSRLDQKSERSGNFCGPWYDLWGVDNSVSYG